MIFVLSRAEGGTFLCGEKNDSTTFVQAASCSENVGSNFFFSLSRGGDVAIWDMSKLHGAGCISLFSFASPAMSNTELALSGVDESAGLSAVCLARW